MKKYECLIDLSNSDHSVKIVDKNGNVEDILATKFKFIGKSVVQKTFGVPIKNEEGLQSHVFELFQNKEHSILIKSISYKNNNLVLIPEYKNLLVRIVVIPLEIELDFSTLFNFYFYDEEHLRKISLEKILEIAKILELPTEFEL